MEKIGPNRVVTNKGGVLPWPTTDYGPKIGDNFPVFNPYPRSIDVFLKEDTLLLFHTDDGHNIGENISVLDTNQNENYHRKYAS